MINPRCGKSPLAASMSALVIALAAAPAVAQPADVANSDESDAGEIIVTAQRREQSLLSVPLSVSAVTGDQLVQRAVTDSTQLSSLVPNLQVSSSYGRTEPAFSMRGVSIGNEFNTNQASPIGIYVDDAYMASRVQHGSQIYDLERVEVLRGPQGTLFGRNTTGGAINFITRKPSLTGANGYAEAGYGNYDAIHGPAALEFTPVTDVIGIRVVGNYDRNDARFENVYPGGKDADKGHNYSGRALVRIAPADGLDVLLKAYGSRDRMTQVALRSNPDGMPNSITGYSEAGLPYFKVNSDALGLRHTSTWGFLARIAYKANEHLELSSVTSRDLTNRHIINDSDASPDNLANSFWRSRTKQINQELKATLSYDGLNLIVGGYFGKDFVTSSTTAESLFFSRSLGLPAVPFGPGTILIEFDQHRTSKALFTQADYDLDAHWAVTLGFRYTWDKIVYANGRAFVGDYDFNPFLYTTGSAAAPLPDQIGKNSEPTGRVALTYTADSGAIVYASYSRGYRAGAFNGSALFASAVNLSKPEKVDAYEIGAKGRFFGNVLSFAGSLFYMDYKDAQVLAVRPTDIFPTLLNADQKLFGAELELSARLSRALALRGSVGLLHSEYKSTIASGTDIGGNVLPLAPKVTATLGADITLPDIGGGSVMFTPNAAYASKQYFTIFEKDLNSGDMKQDGYVKVDATLAWKKAPFTFRLWANNLFQKKYYIYAIDLSVRGTHQFVPGQPRTYGATLRVDL